MASPTSKGGQDSSKGRQMPMSTKTCKNHPLICEHLLIYKKSKHFSVTSVPTNSLNIADAPQHVCYHETGHYNSTVTPVFRTNVQQRIRGLETQVSLCSTTWLFIAVPTVSIPEALTCKCLHIQACVCFRGFHCIYSFQWSVYTQL